MKKVKIITSLLFFGLITEVLIAKEFNVTVVDKEIEIPLEGVIISVDSIDQTWETDENGEIKITIPDDALESQNSLTLSAYMPGYAKNKIRINSETEDLTINLSIEDVLEGKELVVEQDAYQQTDAKTGISVVITRDQFDNASMIGSIPDVMSAVKTLPGVTYMGSFSQQPSIRGAYPYEMAAVLDGMYVYSPFHWSGAVSIFDPQFIQSVKLSHGIFSAKYGHATAGLLDITTVTPEDESIKFNISVSDVITDGVLQVPVTDKLGFIFGYRVSYYDTVPWILDNTGLTKLIMKYGYREDTDLSPEDIEFINNFRITNYIEMPNMQDFYGKIYFNPTDRFHITLNEFYGHEGIGFHLNNDTETFTEHKVTLDDKGYFEEEFNNFYKNQFLTNIAWKNIFHFGSINFQFLPTNKLQINTRAGYNSYNSTVLMNYTALSQHSNTTHSITPDVSDIPAEYDYDSQEPELDDDEKYLNLPVTDVVKHYSYADSVDFSFEDSYKVNVLQGKLSADYSINNTNIVSMGFEEFYKTRSSYNLFKFLNYGYNNDYSSTLNPETGEYEDDNPNHQPIESNTLFSFGLPPVDGNQILNSVAYSTWEFGDSNSFLQGETGFRFEHYYVFNKAPNARKKVNLSSMPTWNPRVSISMKPKIKSEKISDLTITMGTGMFSELNDMTMQLNSDYEIVGGKFKPDQNIFSIMGTSFSFLDDFSFQFEGYYKYYLNRFYSVGSLTNGNIIQRLLKQAMDEEYEYTYLDKAFFDGTGHIFGFDTMLQKKTGRYFDGYLCYSFIFARYLNPFQTSIKTADGGNLTTDSDDPLGNWYYPYFHRFHTFSMVLNYRPTNSLVLTLTGSVCSGVPISPDSIMNKLMGTEEMKRTRTGISYPINFRIGKTGFYKTTKMQYEWFAGFENILGFMNKDSLLGAVLYMNSHQDEDEMYLYAERLANFDVGIPTFSIGFRASM